MNLHEYQSKQLLKAYDILVPYGVVLHDIEAMEVTINKLSATYKYVVKAQVHAGGRGKAGGVRLVNNKSDLEKAIHDLLHTQLVTPQTDKKGQPINALLIEEQSDIVKELYLSLLVDRKTKKIMVMASTEGGMDIEQVVQSQPEKIVQFVIDPLLGIMPYQCRAMGFSLGFSMDQIKQLTHILQKLGDLFIDKDLSLIEINPLIINKSGTLVCLDAKITVDDSALYRQADLHTLHDATQEDPREELAKAWDLSYVALEGNIACMVNGAGLAMATMDLIHLAGGEAANFLDVGGSATQERIVQAFKIILADRNVKGILVNIFGGIVRCDLIAEGIIEAVKAVGVQVPIVVRLEGNRSDMASELIEKFKQTGVQIESAHGLMEAAEKIVKIIKIIK